MEMGTDVLTLFDSFAEAWQSMGRAYLLAADPATPTSDMGVQGEVAEALVSTRQAGSDCNIAVAVPQEQYRAFEYALIRAGAPAQALQDIQEVCPPNPDHVFSEVIGQAPRWRRVDHAVDSERRIHPGDSICLWVRRCEHYTLFKRELSGTTYDLMYSGDRTWESLINLDTASRFGFASFGRWKPFVRSAGGLKNSYMDTEPRRVLVAQVEGGLRIADWDADEAERIYQTHLKWKNVTRTITVERVPDPHQLAEYRRAIVDWIRDPQVWRGRNLLFARYDAVITSLDAYEDAWWERAARAQERALEDGDGGIHTIDTRNEYRALLLALADSGAPQDLVDRIGTINSRGNYDGQSASETVSKPVLEMEMNSYRTDVVGWISREKAEILSSRETVDPPPGAEIARNSPQLADSLHEAPALETSLADLEESIKRKTLEVERKRLEVELAELEHRLRAAAHNKISPSSTSGGE